MEKQNKQLKSEIEKLTRLMNEKSKQKFSNIDLVKENNLLKDQNAKFRIEMDKIENMKQTIQNLKIKL